MFSTGSSARPVVDPVDVVLGKVLVHRGVEFFSARQVSAERLFHHEPGPAATPSCGDSVGNAAEQW